MIKSLICWVVGVPNVDYGARQRIAKWIYFQQYARVKWTEVDV
jgi:hypothetical protein